jgi:hypothetical protein
MAEDAVGPAAYADELFDPDAKKTADPEFRSNADRKALKKQATTDKQKAISEENDLRTVLSTAEGVRFLVRLLMRCGIDQPAYWPDHGQMCEIAGRRQVANDLRDWIKDCGLELWFRVEDEFESHRRPKPKTESKGSAVPLDRRVT